MNTKLNTQLIIILLMCGYVLGSENENIVDPNNAPDNTKITKIKYKLKDRMAVMPASKNGEAKLSNEIAKLLSSLENLTLATESQWVHTSANKTKSTSLSLAEAQTGTRTSTETLINVAVPEEKTNNSANPNNVRIKQGKSFTLMEVINNCESIEEIIELLPNNNEEIKNPEEIAYTLYELGEYNLSAKFYKLAQSRLHEKTDNYDKKLAWYLFQIGNCYKSTNCPEAINYYQKMIGKYPNCPWCVYAKAELELIDKIFEQQDFKNIIQEIDYDFSEKQN